MWLCNRIGTMSVGMLSEREVLPYVGLCFECARDRVGTESTGQIVELPCLETCCRTASGVRLWDGFRIVYRMWDYVGVYLALRLD